MPFCPQCGTSNPDGARFCQSCGKPIPASTAPPAAPGAPPPYPPAQGPAAYPPPGAPPMRRKNPSTAAALGLLWGLGGQAFYNGQPLKAVVQIIVNFLFVWRFIVATGGGAAWFLGLAVASIFMFDGYKVAQKINTGVPVGPWTFF